MVTFARRWWLVGLIVLLSIFILATTAILLWWLPSRTAGPDTVNEPPGSPTVIGETAATFALLDTAVPTPTAAPSSTPAPTPLSTACPQAPAPRWANTLYAEFANQLGCPVSAEISVSASEIPANGAFQYFERGTMIWRQHGDMIYVLYDDGTYVAFPDDSPPNYYESDLLKGGFGYLWNSNEDVRGLIGDPLTIEYAAADFALQDFTSGTILYFFDSGGMNYILFADQGSWILRPQS
jgi:hypothetical protein